MRSPADRAPLEHALRATAVAALGLALWRWTRPEPPAAARAPEVVEGHEARAALARWTRRPAEAGHAALAALPDPETRDWLRALRGAGMRVTWSADSAPALAVSGERSREPDGAVRVRLTAPPSLAVAVGDEAGAVDSARARGPGGGASVALAAAGDTLVARAAGTTARVRTPAAPALRPVLVVARAGWEGKFVVAALEERGWTVRARLSVMPGVTVGQGEPAAATPLDTATTAALVALDSASLAAVGVDRVARYVRAGGGLVLAGDAALAVPALAPARTGARIPGVLGAIAGETPRRGLGLHPLVGLAADAVALERRPGDGGGSAAAEPVAAAARRLGAGRVVQLGYDETWRWRLEGNEGAPEAHRRWWSGAVGAAAYAPVAASGDGVGTALDPAPLASAVDALGAASAVPGRSAPRLPSPSRIPDPVLLGTALVALLGEVASRRLRGER